MQLGSIRVRILLAFALSLAAFTGALGYGLVQLRDIGEGLLVLDEGYLPIASVAAELEAVARQLDREHDRFARDELRPLPGHRANAAFFQDSLADGVVRGHGIVAAALALTTDPDERKALENMDDVLGDVDQQRVAYDAAFAAWLDARESASAEQVALDAAALSDLGTRRKELVAAVGLLSQLVEGRIEMVSARTSQAQTRAYAVSGALAGLAVLLAGVLAAVALVTLRPISRLTAQVQRVAAGEDVGRINVRGADEIALLAGEFNKMVEAVDERDRRLKERAEALDRLSLRLRRVLDTIRAGLVVVDQGTAAMANPAATRLWQVQESAALPPALASLQPGRHEALSLGDRLFDIDVVRFGEKGLLIVGEDVTQRLGDQERLARSERLALVGQMLAQITHEVRNPLNAMSLNTELLAEDLVDEEARAMLATIATEIARLEALTARYLELSRGRRPELSPADPTELVRDVIRVEEAALRQEGVTVEIVGDEGGVSELDVDALRRALRNLLLNAVEAGAKNIQVRVVRQGSALQVAVEDDGPGMSAERVRRVFEPFYTTKARGTGLGLAISRQEIEDVGGHVRCESAVGEGTTFVVEVPLA
jgi:signal transduction histidine kinase/HAMP domain-containing protein